MMKVLVCGGRDYSDALAGLERAGAIQFEGRTPHD